VIGVLAYGGFEGWAPLDSVYYLTATATTNGDEIVPLTAGGKLFSCVYILLGITVVFGGISPLALYFLEHVQTYLLEPLAQSLAVRSDGVLRAMARLAVSLEHATLSWPASLQWLGTLVAAAARWTHANAKSATGISANTNAGTPALAPLSASLAQVNPSDSIAHRSPLTRQQSADPSGAIYAGRADQQVRRSSSSPGHLLGRGATMQSSSPAGLTHQLSSRGIASVLTGDGAASRPHAATLSALQGYLLALLLILLVCAMGVGIAVGVHHYSVIDALYWTIGCITTAGGDLHADNDVLKVLYIVYMPISAVAMLTAARKVYETSLRRNIRLDNFGMHVHSLLLGEARRRGEREASLREAEFIVAVLESRKMIDAETVDAIRTQFLTLVRRDGDKEPIIDAKTVFTHLVRQGRVASAADAGGDDTVMGRRTPLPSSTEDKMSTVLVDTTSKDGGFAEWFEGWWTPAVEGADGNQVSQEDANDTTHVHPPDGYKRLLEA